MKQYIYFTLAIFFTLILPTSAHAEPITLDAYIQLVHQNSPQLASAQAELAVVHTELSEAKRLPNPSINMQTAQRAAGENTLDGAEYEIMLEQPLLVSGQRSARKKLAQLHIEAAEFELQATAIDIITQAHQAFTELLVAQQKSQLFESAMRDIEKIHQIVEGRVQEGAQNPYDLLLIDVAITELIVQHHETLNEIRQAQAELTRLISKPGSHPKNSLRIQWIAQGNLEPPTDTNTLIDWQNIRTTHPTLQSAIRSHQAATSAIQLAKTERWPELNLGLGTKITTDESSFNILAAIGFALPIFDHGQTTIARAQAEATAAQRTRELHESQLHTQLQHAIEHLQAQHDILQTFRARTQTRLPRIRQMAQESYATGQSDFHELLDALQGIHNMHLLELDLLANLRKAHIEFTAATGHPQ